MKTKTKLSLVQFDIGVDGIVPLGMLLETFQYDSLWWASKLLDCSVSLHEWMVSNRSKH